MPRRSRMRTPLVCRWLTHMASWVVPARQRAEWRATRLARLEGLWVLMERGELAPATGLPMASFLLSSFTAAFWCRFESASLRRWSGGPVFPIALPLAVIGAIGLVSHGFARTRLVISVAKGITPVVPRPHSYDPRGDFVVAHLIPIAMALGIGLMMLAIGRRSLSRRGWRYWLFFAAKTGLIAAASAMLWIEGGALVRAAIPHRGVALFAGGLLLGLGYVFAFGWAVLWSLADQRRRCPVCLRRLELPVTIGSWASVFDPATTELVCPDGHGSLAVLEPEAADQDHWVKLDKSWREV